MRGIELRRSGLDGRMDYLADNWGSLASGLGVLLSAAGVVYAYLARRAAKSAEAASEDTRRAVIRTLNLADLQGTVDLIDRLKDHLMTEDWSAALELYSAVRSMLADIRARIPPGNEDWKAIIANAMEQVTRFESRVRNWSLMQISDVSSILEATDALTAIQDDLEIMRSSAMFPDETGGGGN